MGFSLLEPLREMPIAVIDVETTGASAAWGDRVIEVGVARIEGGIVSSTYEQLIDPQRRISAGITALTGISPAMCEGQPTFAEQLDRLLPMLNGAVVMGHNVRFDLSFIDAEFRRARVDMKEALNNPPVFDTVRIARRLFGRGGNGLQSLCRRLGHVPTTAHRALADALATACVFERMIEPLGGWQMPLCDALLLQGGPIPLVSPKSADRLLPLELEEALETKCCVMMEYLDASDIRTQRVVQPLELRRVNGQLILIAHCQLRNDRRNFKLERIVQLTRMHDFQPDPADDVQQSAGSRVIAAMSDTQTTPMTQS